MLLENLCDRKEKLTTKLLEEDTKYHKDLVTSQ